MKWIKLCMIILAVILIMNGALFIYSRTMPKEAQEFATKEKPYCFQDETPFWSEITDYGVCGDYLYILYDGMYVLSVYSLNGEYLHSYAVDMMRNGESRLYGAENVLFMRTRDHDYLIFQDGVFIAQCSAEDYAQQLSAGDIRINSAESFRKDSDQSRYELRGASVWKVDADGNECKIIHRPAWLCLFQGLWCWGIHGACILGLALLEFLRRKLPAR